MKLTIDQKALAAALTKGGAVAPKNSTVPVVNNVRLSARDGTLSVASTDLDRWAEARVPAEISTPGEITVPAALLIAAVGKLQKAEVTLELDGASLFVKAGRSKYKMATLPAEQFPEWGAFDPSAEFVLDAETFGSIFPRVRWACSKDETRYQLQGVFLHPSGDRLRFVATNGHVLAQAETVIPAGAADAPAVIIPAEAIDTALRVLKGTDVTVRVCATKIAFWGDGVSLASKLIDGSFPDYERVIPPRSDVAFTCNRTDLLESLERATLVTEEGQFSGIMVIPRSGHVEVRSANSRGDLAMETADASFTGEVQAFGANPRYLMSFLTTTFSADDLTIDQETAAHPARIYSEEEPNLVGVLMPIRANLGSVGAA